MKSSFAGILIFSWLFISAIVTAHAIDGTIVFTKSELTRDGFREFILKEIFSEEIWWTFFRRNICVIKPDGTGFKQLTEDDTSYSPQWSPDGSKIGFVSGTRPRMSLHIMNPDGSGRKAATKPWNDIYDFKWSPDSTKILAYIKTKSTRDPEETWVVDVARGTSEKYMGRKEWAHGWNHWAPEGATVVRPNIRLLDALPEETQWPEWSPDNRYIAFIHNNKLAIADTEVVGVLEDWRLGEFDPPCERLIDWSPDGSKFLFLGGGYVSSVGIDATGLTNLSMSKSTDACWSADGEYIAYTSANGHKENTEIFIMKADGTGHIQLTNTNYFHIDVNWR